MTTEQEFIRTFKIEGQYIYYLENKYGYKITFDSKDEVIKCIKEGYKFAGSSRQYGLKVVKVEVKPITPEIVLKLEVILCNFHSEHECCLLITGNSIENITINILKECIELEDEIQDQVRGLFNV